MSLPNYLGPLGYRVGLAGKVHVAPQSFFPFESIGGFDFNCVRSPTQPHRLDEVTEFSSLATQASLFAWYWHWSNLMCLG